MSDVTDIYISLDFYDLLQYVDVSVDIYSVCTLLVSLRHNN